MSIEDMIRGELNGTTDRQDLPIPDAVRRRIDETLAALVGKAADGQDMMQGGEQSKHDAATLPGRRPAARSPNRTRRLAIAFVLLLLSMSVWIASNPQTVKSMKPHISSIFGWFGDAGVKRNLPLQKTGDLPILAEVKNNGYILRIHEAFYDGLQVSFTYTFRKEQGEIPPGTYVIPDFQLAPSAKKLLGSTRKFDNGGLHEGYAAGVVKYFVQKKLPNSFDLEVNVPKFGMSEKDNYTVRKGDWSFALPIKGEDHSRTVQWDEPLHAERERNSFDVVSLRMSDTAAEWRLRLQIPLTARLDMVKQRESITYRIMDEDGNELEQTGVSKSGRDTDHGNPAPPDALHIEDVLTHTPPIRNGSTVTVVPVYRTMTEVNGQFEAKDAPMDELAIQVPVD
ncbi:DUF4179 domain-containing protein [Cohnella panacarvi]|uniref:DUF4179 domain-containing protein n=1 Tax=Cohnella panacarvi TaxID=400776 RepID=UPI00047CFE13|nr:DUF4179 domain-containing protein [Cohnella panacarvi]